MKFFFEGKEGKQFDGEVEVFNIDFFLISKNSNVGSFFRVFFGGQNRSELFGTLG